MKITTFALALNIIWFDRAVANLPAGPTFATANEDDQAADATASVGVSSALTFTPMTPEELVGKFISVNGGVEVSNISASQHHESCTRFFTGGYSMGFAYENDDRTTLTNVHLLPDEGIMLSSGDPLEFNSNDDECESTDWGEKLGLGNLFDADLANVAGTTDIFDACYIEFDFKCPDASTPTVSFKYMFGSDEYNEFVGTEFNDAFALILNGVNIAKLPSSDSSTDVVSINNVNYDSNREYFHVNDPADTAHQPSDGSIYPQLEADGFTVILTAAGTASQDPNTIKIVVGDIFDANLDSWVLLEGGSFSCSCDGGDCSVPGPGPSPGPGPGPAPGPTSKSGKSGYSKSPKSTVASSLHAQKLKSGAALISNIHLVCFGVSILAVLGITMDQLI